MPVSERHGAEPPRVDAKKRSGRLAWGLFTLAWVCFIWGHSLIQGPESSQESGLVYAILKPLFDAAGLTDASAATFVIRKLAHFSEYAVLGVSVSGLARAFADAPARARALIWCAGCLVPVLDETIQLFVPGRCGSPRDVCIDLAGFFTGALLAHAASRLRRRARGARPSA